jgi:hypothetical protein
MEENIMVIILTVIGHDPVETVMMSGRFIIIIITNRRDTRRNAQASQGLPAHYF